jgi:hypothetical protein
MRADLAWRCLLALAALAAIERLREMLPPRHGCAGVAHAMTLGCW